MRSPEEIIGADALLQLTFEGYTVTRTDAVALDIGPDDFEEWWTVYDYKTGKPAAQRAYKAARKRGHTKAALLNYAAAYKLTRKAGYWLHASTFLNNERWSDQQAPAALKGIDAQIDNFRQRMENGNGVDARGLERSRGPDPQTDRRLSYDRRG